MSSDMKTIPTNASVEEFLHSIENPVRQHDAKILTTVMTEITGKPAIMWGPSIVGFGTYHYKYASGREGDMPQTAFSPRKQNLTVYFNEGFGDFHAELLAKLGPHTTSKACLYIKSLNDIDMDILREMIKKSYFESPLPSNT